MPIIPSARRVRFGQFEMDEHAGELRKELKLAVLNFLT
jgi:hypothetical protein